MQTPTQAVKAEAVRSATLRLKPYALIGKKLDAMFEVPTDASAAMDALLQQLDRKN